MSEEKKNFYQVVEKIFRRDNRYKPDAYEFLMQSLHFSQDKLKRSGHVNARELLDGIREYAIEQYGPMAKTVLSHWGVTKTQDFGNIVFNMVGENILSKTETDSLDDFKDVYDFEIAFGNVLRDAVIKETD